MKRIITCFTLLLAFQMMDTRAQSKGEKEIIKKVYAEAFTAYYHSKPSYFVLVDSTTNDGVTGFNFAELVNDLQLTNDSSLSSSWYPFLNKINRTAKKPKREKITLPPTIHTIRILSEDSIRIFFEGNYQKRAGLVDRYGWADGWVELSNVFFNKNKRKAVLAINHTWNPKNAHTFLLFLEKKRRGKWQVCYSYRASIA